MPKVMLNISRAENGKYLVVVNGGGFYTAPTNAEVGVRLRGDDTWFDDNLGACGLAFPATSCTTAVSSCPIMSPAAP